MHLRSSHTWTRLEETIALLTFITAVHNQESKFWAVRFIATEKEVAKSWRPDINNLVLVSQYIKRMIVLIAFDLLSESYRKGC